MKLAPLIDRLIQIRKDHKLADDTPVAVFADHGQEYMVANDANVEQCVDPTEYMIEVIHPDDIEEHEDSEGPLVPIVVVG